MPIPNPEEWTRQSKQACDRAYADCMTDSMVRFAVSLIPTGNDPDLVKTILASVFEKGFMSGRSYMVNFMAEQMLAYELERRKGKG